MIIGWSKLTNKYIYMRVYIGSKSRMNQLKGQNSTHNKNKMEEKSESKEKRKKE